MYNQNIIAISKEEKLELPQPPVFTQLDDMFFYDKKGTGDWNEPAAAKCRIIMAKYEIHGYIKPTLRMPWILLDPPQGYDTDDYLQIQDSMRRIGINYYIIEVRRNPLWVEPTPAPTSTAKGGSGSKSSSISNQTTDSTSSETQLTEDPMDTT